MSVTIEPMRPTDALLVRRQASQRVQLGIDRDLDEASARDLAENGEAWTCWRRSHAIALFGLRETFPGAQSVAWAVLSDGIGRAHLAISRHARERVAASGYARIEAIVRSTVDVEQLVAAHGALDPGQMLAVVVEADRGPELQWARLLGLAPVAVLRKFGAASEPHILCERIR